MKNKNLIACSGKIGSGKDTVASIIQYLTSELYRIDKFTFIEFQNYGKPIDWGWTGPYQIKKFAGKLKEIVVLLTGCTLKDLEDQDFKNKELSSEWGKSQMMVKAPTYRELLQYIGTNALRDKIHENIWVNALFADYKPEGLNKDGFFEQEMFGDKVLSVPHPILDMELYPKWIISDMRFPNELEAVKKRGGITIRINRDNGTRAIDLNPHPSETALGNAEFDHIIDNSFDINGLVDQVKNILQMEDII